MKLSSLNRLNPIFIILFITFALRFFLFIGEAVHLPAPLFTPDPHYHTRRVQLLVKNYPYLPVFDYYIAYPTGGYCIWPPLFDFLAGTLAYLLFLGKPTFEQVEWVCAIYPILYGMAVVLMTYLITKRLFNKKLAFFSSLLAAILPGTISWSRLGYNDHHIAETLALLLIIYFLISNQENKINHWIYLGISFGIGMLLWQGSILFVGLAFFILIFSQKFNSIISFIISLLMILPFSINTHFPDSPFSYRGLSLLHVSLLAGAIYIMGIWILSKKFHWVFLPLLSSITIILFIFFRTKIPTGGFSFLIKNDPWLKTIMEFQPLIVQSGYLETLSVKYLFGRAYYLWPIMGLIIILENRKKEFFIFLTFLIFTGILSFLARRYVVWFTPLFVIVLTYTLHRIYKFVNLYLRHRIFAYIILGAIIFVSFEPLINKQYYSSTWSIPKDDEVSYKWLNDSTPETSYFFNPDKKPEYGIMCFWGDGHQILYYAKRPVAACNFGNDVSNFKTVNQFFLTETEEEANAVLDELECRYIYLKSPVFLIKYAAEYLNIKPTEFLNYFPCKVGTQLLSTIMTPNERGLKTTTMRLSLFYGSGFYFKDNFYPPYRHYRLRFVSPQKSIIIFEYVRGATIKGYFNPLLPVKISYKVSIPGFDFIYYDSLSTDSTGAFMSIVPYPTSAGNLYELTAGNKKFNFSVSEDNIKSGDTIYIKQKVAL